ncbi:MAG TPA: hypothetical protein VGL81_32395 [Polyangiaceae bacterium]
MSSRIGAERTAACALVLAALVGSSHAARADGASAEDAAVAQSLFDEARRLMIADRFAQACPKLADSYRLDPALGTLLNLAVCNERLGKTASAWAEYRDAESIAKREGRAGRVTYAREHAAQLEPRLSHLVLVRAEGNTDRGLEVQMDGVTVGEPALGSAIPVDPGAHRVEASATRKKPWSVEVTVGDRAEEKRVAIPLLEDAPLPAPPPPPPPSGATVEPTVDLGPAASSPLGGGLEPRTSPHASRTLFYVVGTSGMASLAFGAVAGMQAIVRWNDRLKLCAGDGCTQSGLNADGAARSWALASDIGLGVGAVGIAAAGYLFWSASAAEAPRAGAVHVAPTLSSRSAGLGVNALW